MPYRMHIVAGYIHKDICESMIHATQAVSTECNAVIDRIIWVPGSLEVPLAVTEILLVDRPDAIIVFGVQQEGKTKHGEIIAQQVTRKLLDIQIEQRIPMAVSIIGPNASLEHAAGKAEYVGQKAMRAAAHMIHLLEELKK
jgi:6,7-dimethyl-8-ribityllumazine synthase